MKKTAIFFLCVVFSFLSIQVRGGDLEREKFFLKLETLEGQGRTCEREGHWFLAMRFYRKLRNTLRFDGHRYMDRGVLNGKRAENYYRLGLCNLEIFRTSKASSFFHRARSYFKKIAYIHPHMGKADYQMARLYAIAYKGKKSGSDQPKINYQNMRKYLMKAKKNGFPVMRRISKGDFWVFLRRDIPLILQLSTPLPVKVEKFSDPFLPRLGVPLPPEKETWSKPLSFGEQRKLLGEITRAFRLWKKSLRTDSSTLSSKAPELWEKLH